MRHADGSLDPPTNGERLPDGRTDHSPSLWSAIRCRLAYLALIPAFLAGFSAISVHNFGGWDEWLIVSLTSKGITSFPYANRPLALAWALPGVFGLPSSLAGYWLAHTFYLGLAGLLVAAIVRRIAPGLPGTVALVAGASALTWTPLDLHRLNPLNNLMYSGATAAALVALWCLVLWASGRGRAVLAAGVLAALLACLSYEGTLGLLAGGGAVLLVALGPQRRRPVRSIALPWTLTVCLAAALAGAPVVLGMPSYQVMGLGLDASPDGVLSRLLAQFRWHLGPLFAAPPAQIASGRVALAVLAFCGAVALAGRRPGAVFDRRRLGVLVAAGFALAASSWGPMLLSPALAGPDRMQGFSAPGIGMLLAGLAGLAATWLPSRWSGLAAALLGGWIVAAGTAHTLAQQHRWDARSLYPQQARLLRNLLQLVPDVRPGSVFILLDDDRAFAANFTFRHAISYLYEGRALGVVPGGHEFLYPFVFAPAGLTIEPWTVIRGPWGETPQTIDYGRMIVLLNSGGTLRRLERWPSPPLPETGATAYAPEERVVAGPRRPRGAVVGNGQ